MKTLLLLEKILKETDPLKIHTLGKRIRKYDETKWQPESFRCLYEANVAKFTQLPLAKATLLATGNDALGEATNDPTFGIGLRITDPNALDTSKWTGKNLFGQVLERIRSELQTD